MEALLMFLLMEPYTLQTPILPPTELPQAVSILLGLFSAAVTQFFKRRFLTRNSRFIVSMGLSVLVGGISAFVTDTNGDLPSVVISVIAYSQLSYSVWKTLWENVNSSNTKPV